MAEDRYDVVVVGSGTGGYAAALRALKDLEDMARTGAPPFDRA